MRLLEDAGATSFDKVARHWHTNPPVYVVILTWRVCPLPPVPPCHTEHNAIFQGKLGQSTLKPGKANNRQKKVNHYQLQFQVKKFEYKSWHTPKRAGCVSSEYVNSLLVCRVCIHMLVTRWLHSHYMRGLETPFQRKCQQSDISGRQSSAASPAPHTPPAPTCVAMATHRQAGKGGRQAMCGFMWWPLANKLI